MEEEDQQLMINIGIRDRASTRDTSLSLVLFSDFLGVTGESESGMNMNFFLTSASAENCTGETSIDTKFLSSYYL